MTAWKQKVKVMFSGGWPRDKLSQGTGKHREKLRGRGHALSLGGTTTVSAADRPLVISASVAGECLACNGKGKGFSGLTARRRDARKGQPLLLTLCDELLGATPVPRAV